MQPLDTQPAADTDTQSDMSRESISGQKQPASTKEDWPLLGKEKADAADNKKSRVSQAGGWSHLLPAIIYGESGRTYSACILPSWAVGAWCFGWTATAQTDFRVLAVQACLTSAVSSLLSWPTRWVSMHGQPYRGRPGHQLSLLPPNRQQLRWSCICASRWPRHNDQHRPICC